MPTLRTSVIPMALAERVVQYSWLTLERYQLPTPRLAVREHANGREGRLLSVEIGFRPEAQFPMFVERLRRRFPACKFAVLGAPNARSGIGSPVLPRSLATLATSGRRHQDAV